MRAASPASSSPRKLSIVFVGLRIAGNQAGADYVAVSCGLGLEILPNQFVCFCGFSTIQGLPRNALQLGEFDPAEGGLDLRDLPGPRAQTANALPYQHGCRHWIGSGIAANRNVTIMATGAINYAADQA